MAEWLPGWWRLEAPVPSARWQRAAPAPRPPPLCGRDDLSRAALDVAHRLEQGLITLLRGSIAINLQQLSEVAHEGRVGEKLCPIRTGAGILRVTHRIEMFPANLR